MFLFLMLVAALIILWRFTRLDHGIKTDITNNHYAWTYGPTALLVVISVAWGQVDYHCRLLAPWAHLQSGPTSARQSLLLDYVSPALPKTLLAATIYHDWAVLASGLAALLLKIVIVFSTGLLVLTPTLVSTTISDAVINSRIAGLDSTLVTTDLVTQLSLYYGIQERGMDYPYGTTATVAYDTVDLEPLRPNSTITAMVDGMFPFFDCEVVTPVIVGDNFTWTNDSWTDPGDRLDLTLTLYPKNCPPLVSAYKTICMAPVCPVGRSIYSDEIWNTPYGYQWNRTQPLEDLDPCANLYQLTVIDMTYERVAGRSPNSSAGWDVNLQNQIGLVCGLGYTINKVNVSINTADPVSVDGVNTTGPLRRVADVLLGLSYYNTSQDFVDHFTVNSLPPLKDTKIYGFAKLVAILAGGSATTLLNGTILKDMAEKAFKGVAVQFAQSHLPKSNDVTTTATSSYTDARLQLRQVSLWAMGTSFVLLAICVVAVLVWRKRDVVSLNPESIGSQAVILAASPSLQKWLTAAAGRSEVQLKASLEDLVATSCVKRERKISEFLIETAAPNGGKEQSPNDTTNLYWWTARPRQVWFGSVALILPLAVIAALEIAQHESDKHHGLATVSATSSVEHSLPSILSSIVMISIAMIYDAIGFVAATLAPYEKLARGNTTARRNILESSVGVLPVWSTFEAIRAHHFKAAVASVAVLIGSLLTIISSGLYTLDTVAFALDITVTTSDKFVPSFGTSTDDSAGAIFTLVEHNNASYPALTYDGLAFPDMDLTSLGNEAMKQLSDPEEPVTLHASVVATRASLNCTLVPRDIINITMMNVADHWSPCLANQLTFNTSLPPTCPHFLDGNNETATEISFAFTVQQLCPKNAVQALYQSVVLNNQGATGTDTFDTSVGSTLGAITNPPGCPSLAFLTGYFVENVTSAENVTAMTCIQGLEEVRAWTAFAITKDSIQIKSEPVVDESSTRWLMAFNSTYWFTNFNTFTSFDVDHNTMLLDDYFYDSVRYGPQGVPVEEYTGPSNTQRFIDVTQHTYRRYMAQLISSTMRKSLNSTELASSPPSYSGTVSGVNRLRLKQNATSKLILQIFLGIMLACGVFVYSYRRVRQLLPHSPYSIAGTMSLLAGSEMIERNILPAGAEFMSEKELARVFDGYLFSLGWWGDSSEKEGTGVVGRRQQSRRFGIDIGSAHGRVKA